MNETHTLLTHPLQEEKKPFDFLSRSFGGFVPSASSKVTGFKLETDYTQTHTWVVTLRLLKAHPALLGICMCMPA